ncbi:MAG: type II toxin-antitoxin system RelE/ParE family toxin [Bacteroidetes bacterium]|nr:type II toxin-antitoxin system RelE/ParE family toxin [Bacteroidota bacterium]
MVKVVWTDFAIRDLNDIGEYIAKDSERYAKVVIQNLFESTDLLESHPKAGRIVPEFNNKNLRELIRGSYRIVYRVVDIYRIDILTVHNSTRLLTKSTLYKRKK